MLVVDSGVWIDFFNGAPSPARATLRRVLADGEVEVLVPDLVLYEVLRGFLQAQRLLQGLSVVPTGGAALATAAAGHDRALRAAGITVRSPLDVLLASYCIAQDHLLLHADRDFDAFEPLRGLRCWRH